jgi:hypothetical protein
LFSVIDDVWLVITPYKGLAKLVAVLVVLLQTKYLYGIATLKA